MYRLFSQDSLIFRFLNRFAELIYVNLLMILFSLPVVTVGASIAAGCCLTRQILNDEAGKITASFWQAFRGNWKQATVIWIGELALLVGLLWDYYLLQSWFTEKDYVRVQIGLTVLILLVVSLSTYLYFLISRYDNTLINHIKNAFALFFHYLPRSVLMAVLNALPFVLFLLSPMGFLHTFVVWAGFGFALILYIDNAIMRGIFARLEEAPED